MTAPIRSSIPMLNLSVAAGQTKGGAASAANATVNAGWTDVSSLNGGRVGILMTNGSAAPGNPLCFTVQVSDTADGTNAIDLWSGSADIIAGNPTSLVVPLPAEFKYARVLPFGNTTNAVQMKATAFMKA